jgi:glucokinase
MNQPTTLGIDFGGTSIKFGVVQNGRIIRHGNLVPTGQDGEIEPLIGSIVDEILRLQQEYPALQAVGFGVPGIIDPAAGVVVNLTNVKGWHCVPLGALVSERIGLVTNLENDAKAMAYAEWKYGAGHTLPNVICVTLGTGIGGGLILNGRLYRGSTKVAGEIGQTSIDYQGKEFVYGNKGALEAYVGHVHISERAKEIYAQAGKAISDAEADPPQLAVAANAGDPLAKQLWEDIGLKLGVGLINAIWLLNPDRIVLGGGVAKCGDLLFQPIWRTIESRCERTFWEKLEIVPATLGNDAGIIGAAALPLESEFVTPRSAASESKQEKLR